MPIPSLKLKFDNLGPIQEIPSECFSTLLTATKSELITEAIKFFDLRDRGRNGIIKDDWPRLTFDLLNCDIRKLRSDFNTALQSLLHKFYLMKPSDFIQYYKDDEQNYYIPINDKKKSNTYNDNSIKARFTIRIFLSDQFRTDRFVESKQFRKGYFQGIKFEKIPSTFKRLRDAVSEFLQDPDLIALPTETVKKVRAEEGPPTEMLSEHLYFNASMIPQQQKAIELFPSIKKVHEAIDSIETTLAALNQFCNFSKISNYERAIDVLELEFRLRWGEQASKFGLQWAFVLTTLLRAYLSELKLRILVTSLPIYNFYNQYLFNSCIGICLWEAASGRPIKIPSLPNLLDIETPTDNQYKLKSSVTDQQKEHDDKFGFIVREGIEQGGLIGQLSSVFDASKKSIIGCDDLEGAARDNEAPSYTVEDLELVVLGFLEKPIIKENYPPERKGKKNKRPSGPIDRYIFNDMSIDKFEEEIVFRNPVILRGPSYNVCKDSSKRPSLYAITNISPNPVSIVNFGNTYSTQLFFYCASHILSKVSSHFPLNAFYKKQLESSWMQKGIIRKLQSNIQSYDKQNNSQYKLYLNDNLNLERLLENNRFLFTCGSYLHGGSYPPHKTHREGRHYDLSMGPDLIPWRTTNLRETLLNAYNYLKNYPLANPTTFSKPRYTSTIYMCERSPSDIGKKNISLIDHEFMRKLVGEVSSKVKEAKFILSGNTEYVTYEEGSVDVETQINRLNGTPYFLTSDDAELGHIGALSIILSAPTNLIYASPIVVLRCFRSLLRAVQQLTGQKLHLDQVGITEIAQLDDIVHSIIRGIQVVFLPSDHHHHWHLDYPSLHDSSPESSKTDKGKKIKEFNRIEVRLEVLTPLWLLLDLDLTPFQHYLLRIKNGHIFNKDCIEVQQLDEILAFCESYAELRKKRHLQDGFDLVSYQFLHEAFLPHIDPKHMKEIDPEYEDGPWFGWELDSHNNEIADEIKKRSNEIKWQISEYRSALMKICNSIPHDPLPRQLADGLGIFANPDNDTEDFEGPVDKSNEDYYDAWKYSDEVWL